MIQTVKVRKNAGNRFAIVIQFDKLVDDALWMKVLFLVNIFLKNFGGGAVAILEEPSREPAAVVVVPKIKKKKIRNLVRPMTADEKIEQEIA